VYPNKVKVLFDFSWTDFDRRVISFCHEKRVYLEADMMAKKYKEKLPPSVGTQRLEPIPTSTLPFENEALYANWKWFKFEK